MPLITFGFTAQPKFNLLARQTAELSKRAETARTEAVTGRFADQAKAVGGRTAPIEQLERSLAELDDHTQIIGLAEGRASATQAVLTAATDSVNALTANSVTALVSTASGGGRILSEQARQALSGLTGQLNTFFAGRALFSGDGADTSPLVSADQIAALGADSVTDAFAAGGSAGDAYAAASAAFDVGGAFDTEVYRGGSGDAPLVEVTPDERVSIGVKADDPALRAVLRDFAVLAAAFDPATDADTDTRKELADLAVSGLRRSISSLADLQGRLGVSEQRIADVKARNTATEAALTLSYNEITGADEYESSAAVTAIETQLSTAFLTTQRLTNLSLANFLT